MFQSLTTIQRWFSMFHSYPAHHLHKRISSTNRVPNTGVYAKKYDCCNCKEEENMKQNSVSEKHLMQIRALKTVFVFENIVSLIP